MTSADGSVTGTVASVALASDGTAKATLGTGQTLVLDNTVRIGGAPTVAPAVAAS